MTIQLITYDSRGTEEKDGITSSPLCAPCALDDFDINIIDLSVENMWTYTEARVGYTDSNADFKTIHKMVLNKKKSIVVYVLPQNVNYHYNTQYSRINSDITKPIKDILSYVYATTLTEAIYPEDQLPQIAYERTCTSIGQSKYDADLYFDTSHEVITKSDKSEKATTIQLSECIYATTLKITASRYTLKQFIRAMFVKQAREVAPEWMKSICFGDDAEQKSQIEQSEAEIEIAKNKIVTAEKKLEENAKFKSILYTNGDELVEVVFDILEKILACDLSAFVDDKKEDFLIKLPSCTFIGEIKGVTSNVKYEHISQVELHYRGYLDRLAESGISENVKQLLIMNPFRTKALDKREPIHIFQIDLAIRNGCLIIETNTLLRLYEKFCNGEVTSQKCTKIFSSRTGLLCLADLDDDAGDIEPYKG